MTTDDPNPGARLLSAEAHALRNHVATIRSVVRLVDEPEVAHALDEASRALQVAIERTVVLARVELGEAPATVELALAELVSFGARRAGREGATLDDAPDGDLPDIRVAVPGPWAERLVADLLHRQAGAPRLVAEPDAAGIDVPLAGPVEAPLDAALVHLARACGGTLELVDDVARLRLPRAT